MSVSATDRRIRGEAELDRIDFAKQGGLVPVVVQDAETMRVLMVAWASRDAIERTLRTGEMHFWSRSRQELWRKGETSGNVQKLRSLHADCDADTLLALVEPAGPACHTGERTCFGAGGVASGEAPGRILAELWGVLEERMRERPDGSYTTRLLSDENLRLKKLGEEVTELVVSLSRGEADQIPEEAADLVYHLLVALLAAGTTLESVMRELESRRG